MIKRNNVFSGLVLVLLAGVLFLSSPAVLHAQTSGTGIITGSVNNCGGCGGGINGATVRCTYHGETSITSGGYYVMLVPAGTHRLQFSHPSFYTKYKTVTVYAGQSKEASVCLNQR